MTEFIINFISNNLPLVLLVALTLFILSFNSKIIRRFSYVVGTLTICAISIYFLHKLNIVNNNLYYRTIEFVCLLIHFFEICMSLIFNVQSKILENVNYYNFLILLLYTLHVINNIDMDHIRMITFMLFEKYKVITKNLTNIKNKIYNKIIILKDINKNTEEMLC